MASDWMSNVAFSPIKSLLSIKKQSPILHVRVGAENSPNTLKLSKRASVRCSSNLKFSSNLTFVPLLRDFALFNDEVEKNGQLIDKLQKLSVKSSISMAAEVPQIPFQIFLNGCLSVLLVEQTRDFWEASWTKKNSISNKIVAIMLTPAGVLLSAILLIIYWVKIYKVINQGN